MKRRSGKTTRAADKAIQILFELGELKIPYGPSHRHPHLIKLKK